MYVIIRYRKISRITEIYPSWTIVDLAIIHNCVIAHTSIYWIAITFSKMPEIIEFAIQYTVVCTLTNMDSVVIPGKL